MNQSTKARAEKCKRHEDPKGKNTLLGAPSKSKNKKPGQLAKGANGHQDQILECAITRGGINELLDRYKVRQNEESIPSVFSFKASN